MASGVTNSAASVRSPSFSRSSSSTTTTIRPARISAMASSTVAKFATGAGLGLECIKLFVYLSRRNEPREAGGNNLINTEREDSQNDARNHHGEARVVVRHVIEPMRLRCQVSIAAMGKPPHLAEVQINPTYDADEKYRQHAPCS